MNNCIELKELNTNTPMVHKDLNDFSKTLLLKDEMSFNDAIEIMQRGGCVSRAEWDKWRSGNIPMYIKLEQTETKTGFVRIYTHHFTDLKSRCNKSRHKWVPELKDTFANDWFVVNINEEQIVDVFLDSKNSNTKLDHYKNLRSYYDFYRLLRCGVGFDFCKDENGLPKLTTRINSKKYNDFGTASYVLFLINSLPKMMIKFKHSSIAHEVVFSASKDIIGGVKINISCGLDTLIKCTNIEIVGETLLKPSKLEGKVFDELNKLMYLFVNLLNNEINKHLNLKGEKVYDGLLCFNHKVTGINVLHFKNNTKMYINNLNMPEPKIQYNTNKHNYNKNVKISKGEKEMNIQEQFNETEVAIQNQYAKIAELEEKYQKIQAILNAGFGNHPTQMSPAQGYPAPGYPGQYYPPNYDHQPQHYHNVVNTSNWMQPQFGGPQPEKEEQDSKQVIKNALKMINDIKNTLEDLIN